MAQEVWEVVALLHQSQSLGEHTALLEGRLLDQLRQDTEPAGEPRFQVELESKNEEKFCNGMISYTCCQV